MTNSLHPAPFDTSTFIIPAEWHAFSDLLGGADTGLLLLRDGVIIHVNTHLSDQLGFSDTELIGQPVDSLLPPDSGRAADSSNIHLIAKNGKPIAFRFIANRIDTLTDARCTIWVLQPVERPGSETLLQAATRSQAIADHFPEPVLVCDRNAILSYTNHAFDDIVGPRDDDLTALVHPDDRVQVQATLAHAAGSTTTTPIPLAFRLKRRNGSWLPMSGQLRNLLSEPEVGGLMLIVHDTTADEQHSHTSNGKHQLHYFNRLFHMAQHPHANLASTLKVLVKATAKALGAHRCAYWEAGSDGAPTRCISAYDDSRQNFVDEVPEAVFASAFQPMLQKALQSDDPWVIADVDQDPRVAVFCEYFHAVEVKALIIAHVARPDQVPGVLILSQLEQPRRWRKEEAEFVQHATGLISITYEQVERNKTAAQAREITHHDGLTGLPNRQFLFDRIADIFPKLSAQSASIATFFIDLDGFKHINESLGHAVGDELLKAAALRLKNLVRKDDTLVRLGGDEFMLLARNLTNMRVADDIAREIVETMHDTFSLRGHELRISASVGVALYPFDGEDIDTLMKKADIAMYHAKSAGRNRYQMFDPKLNETASKRTALEGELRRAIEERELQHYYQPQIDLRTGEVRCVEALLRWRHPQRGILPPSEFLPVAEQSALIRHISKWVVNDACEQLRSWDQQGLGKFRLAINLSASQLMDRSLLSALETALERTGIASDRLEWEIRETTAMRHNTMASSMLDRTTDLKIGLSIDDFGTGYSNMAYLRRYPVQKVKIDGSFVDGLPDEEEGCAVTNAIISMARPLGLTVVAEGVETAQQVEYLREHGCDIAQGYFFTEPLTAEQFEKWLTRH